MRQANRHDLRNGPLTLLTVDILQFNLLQIEHLEKEKDNPRIQEFVEFVRRWQKILAEAAAPVSPEPEAAPRRRIPRPRCRASVGQARRAR